MIKWINTKPHTKAWHKSREDGYGASEIATVLAADSDELAQLVYKSPITLHLHKIGEPVPPFHQNQNTSSGHLMEPIIINMYKYWDNNYTGDQDGWVIRDKNMADGNRVNKVICRKQFVTNSDYPWLFSSPDGVEYERRRLTEKPYWFKAGVVECKNTTSMETNRYENKISPSFVLQVAQQLLCSGLSYARVLLWIDGFKQDVLTLKADNPEMQELMENIVKFSKESWDKVLAAREAKDAYEIENYYALDPYQYTEQQQTGIALLNNLEPELTGTKTELAFIKDMIKPKEEDVKQPGSDDQYQLIKQKFEYADAQKTIEADVRKNYENILLSMEGANYIYFDDEKKYFSFKQDVKGVKRLYVSPKLKN